jgi:hypothetical protein
VGCARFDAYLLHVVATGASKKMRLTISSVATYDASMNKNIFMKVRVTKDEQAEWRDVCRALGQDFSTIVRDTMKRRAAMAKRKERVTDEAG